MIKEILYRKDLNKKNNFDFSYYEKKTVYKNVNNATNFLFDLGREKGMERQKYVKIVLKIKMLMNKLMIQVHLIYKMLLNVIVRLVVNFIPRMV